MSEPVWLTPEIVLDIQSELIGRFGGRAGLRDRGGLEAAVARPQNKYAYGDGDLAAFAAAYAFGFARSHPFIDGNKRVALASMLVFLGLNDVALIAPEPEATAAMMGLAEREISAEALTRWIRERT